LLLQAPGETVTLGWLVDAMGERSFGVALLLMGLLASLPGASVVAGVLIVVLAGQMMLAQKAPMFPGFVLARRVRKQRLNWMLLRIVPALQALERVARPRWQMPLVLTERVVGTAVLLVSLLLFAPIPLSNVVPALTIVLLSFAYIERDGVALCIALVVALTVLLGTAMAGWKGVLAAGWVSGMFPI
jgi:hypothetical protein